MLPTIAALEKEFMVLKLLRIAASALLVIATTAVSASADQLSDPGLLVPLKVVEPAQWLAFSFGAEGHGKQSLRVAYGDLDLSSSKGVSELYERLRRASERVCVGGAGLNSTSEENLCSIGALAKAVADVNLRSLNELHSG